MVFYFLDKIQTLWMFEDYSLHKIQLSTFIDLAYWILAIKKRLSWISFSSVLPKYWKVNIKIKWSNSSCLAFNKLIKPQLAVSYCLKRKFGLYIHSYGDFHKEARRKLIIFSKVFARYSIQQALERARETLRSQFEMDQLFLLVKKFTPSLYIEVL